MNPAPYPETAPVATQAPGASAPGRAAVAWCLALVFLVSVLAYANSLSNGFTLDDKEIVEHNTRIRGLDQIPLIWSTGYWTNERYIKAYRPITVTTFALNYAVHGLRPAGYHLVNVLLNAAVAALLVLLALKLGVPLAGALLAGLFFAVHPIHTDAASGVVGRAEMLAALAFLGGLLFWLRYREQGRLGDLAALLAIFALGNLSKEQVIVLPVLFVVAELAFHRLRDPVGRNRLALALAGCGVLLAGIFMLRAAVTGTVLGGNLTNHPPVSGFLYGEPLYIRLLTFLKVLQKVARLLLFPIALSPDYSFNQIPIPRGFDRSVLAGVFVALICGAGFVHAWNTPRRFLMVSWAFLIYLPVSNLLMPIPLLLGERTLYVPSIGLAVVLGDWLASEPLRRAGRKRLAAGALVAAIILLWGARTVARVPVWRNQMTLFASGVESSPNSAMLHLNYGTALLLQGRVEEAARQLEIVVTIQPKLAVAHYKLSVLYQMLNEPEKAEAAIRALLRMRLDDPAAWLQLGRVLVMQGRTEDAQRALKRGLVFNHGNQAIQGALDEIREQRRAAKPPAP